MFMSLFVIPLSAQNNRMVKGKIIDENGDPVIGASITINGSSKGTVTDLDGVFTINVPDKAKLKVSYIGYIPQIITNLDNPKIQLVADNLKMDEVVVLGNYGSQSKLRTTGSVEVVSSDELKDLSVGSLGDALIGKVNGLGVSLAGGRPGETPSLQIRQSSAENSVTPASSSGGVSDPSPLYVIDGFISTATAFNDLDISEVENITVLKDAEAAVYGARAAYGVILVQTKRGKMGTPTITYSGQFGYTDAVKQPKMLSAYDYGRVYDAAYAANTATKDIQSDDLRLNMFQTDELDAMKSLDYNILDDEWSAALTQRHSVNISGGTEKATYFGGGSYYTQDGNIGKLKYDRWNFRAGVNARISRNLKATLQLSGNYGSVTRPVNGQGGSTDRDYNTLMTHPRYIPSKIGEYYIYNSGLLNSVGSDIGQMYNYEAIQNGKDNSTNNTDNFTVNGSLEYSFDWCKVLKGLKVKATYGKTIVHNKTNKIATKLNVYRLINRVGSGNHLYTGDDLDVSAANFGLSVLNNGNSLSRDMDRGESYQLNVTASYSRQFGLHYVSGLFSIEKSEASTEDLTGSLPDPLPFTDGQSNSVESTTSNATTTFNRVESGMLSYVGRLDYSYDDRYIFQFLLRSDASTKFAPKNYWGCFPSVGLGWIISDEPWFKRKKLGVDFLKIRASWGLLGKDNVNPWLWTQLYNRNADKGPIFGKSSNTPSGSSIRMPKQGVNEDVHWDKSYKTNIGIDAAFLDNRLAVTLDMYYDKGREMFTSYQGTAYYPNTVGIMPAPENFGKVDSWGTELSLKWKDRIGNNFHYWVGLQTGYSDNKIIETGWKAAYDFDKLVKNKRSDRGVWGLDCMGMFRSYQEIAEYFDKYHITSYLGKTQKDVHPGMLIYRDVRGQYDQSTGKFGKADGVVDEQDFIELSHRADNPYGMTMNFGFSYKSLSFSAQLSGAWGAYGFVPSTMRKESYSQYTNISAFWKDMFVYQDIYDVSGKIVVNQNLTAKYPNIKYSDINGEPSSFWRVSAANLSLRNIVVAYSLPKKWLKVAGVSSVRLNATCQNALFFLNPYPEKCWASWAGSYGKYPNLRKITFGVNITF
ncbi:MAG: TonB-dependent receptor [Prevotella sp.]|nr:TonB-dependent receptor [Prevotella sp.]